jgi:hypothetical protein
MEYTDMDVADAIEVTIYNPNDQDYFQLTPLNDSTNYFDLSINILEVFDRLKNDEIKKTDLMLYESFILILRILNKYESQYFKMIFDNLVDKMKYLFKSKFPRIINSAIFLSSEIFYNYMSSLYNTDWITELLPEIVMIAASKSNFTTSTALSSLKGFTNYVFFEEGIEALVELLSDDNHNVSDISFQALLELLSNMDEITMTMLSGWELILTNIYNLYNVNDDRYSKKAVKLVKFLYQQFYFHIDFYIERLMGMTDFSLRDDILRTVECIVTQDKNFTMKIRRKEVSNNIRISKYHRNICRTRVGDREWFNDVVFPDSYKEKFLTKSHYKEISFSKENWNNYNMNY